MKVLAVPTQISDVDKALGHVADVPKLIIAGNDSKSKERQLRIGSINVRTLACPKELKAKRVVVNEDYIDYKVPF